jgi:hypothetical protein
MPRAAAGDTVMDLQVAFEFELATDPRGWVEA